MTIEIKRNAAETIIEAAGRLDTTTAPALDKAINEDMEGTKNLVLDLKGIEYISSAGLRVILMANQQMEEVDGNLTIKNVNEDVRDVFEMTGFDSLLNLE